MIKKYFKYKIEFIININIKKLTWPISLPVGYMLREHVNRVRFPDWPNYFFKNEL